jgi:predicted ATPase
MCASPEIITFPEGARWVRADFHLHTPADNHFEKFAPEFDWKAAYLDRLKSENIAVGVITNHNRFDCAEYKSLRKAARHHGIALLPGVELSVQGGRSGVHLLLVLDPDTWVFNREAADHPDRFLNVLFEHTPNRESEDTACPWTITQVLEKLDEHRHQGRDSFVIFAHADDAKGAFAEVGPGLGQHFNQLFLRSVLGAQKCRSRNNWNNLRQWVGGAAWEPAKVEGSDCKTLADVGRAHEENGQPSQTWLKLGALTFDAVRLALSPEFRSHRLGSAPARPSHARLVSLGWQGGNGLLDGRAIALSPDLNALIGVRGSGKSTLLESLRYLLDLRISPETDRDDYKATLPEHALGGGGKVFAELVTGDGTTYRIERTLGQPPKVLRDKTPIPNLRPDALLRARYFGQKDLASFGERGFGNELVRRFTDGSSAPAENALLAQVERHLGDMDKSQDVDSRLESLVADLAKTEEDLRRFQELGLADKLKEQIAYEKDVDHSVHAVAQIADTAAALRSARDDHAHALRALLRHQPAGDGVHYADIRRAIERASAALARIENVLPELEAEVAAATAAHHAMEAALDAKKESFAEIRRGLNLQGELNPDTFVHLTRNRDNLLARKKELESVIARQAIFATAMRADLERLRAAWQSAHEARIAEIERLNQSSAEIRILLSYCGDRAAFTEKLRGLISGTLQRPTLEKITRAMGDGPQLYLDLTGDSADLIAAGLAPDQIVKLRDALSPHWRELLGWRAPDKVEITYKGKPLSAHSIGQRATALLQFLLSQNDHDLLIIDQPEDDLDNETLYNEIVTRILALKGRRQLVFVTHSPTIPVLGDAEQVVACAYSPGSIRTSTGGVDAPTIQDEVIRVMEGGQVALERRRRIYESWTR